MSHHAANRGTLSRLPGRFVTQYSEFDSPPSAQVTRYHRERASSVINTVSSPDLPFSRTLNPYRGCEHGCIYCYARPNHGYLQLSPGQDFEAEIYCKDNIAQCLRDTLRSPGYCCQPLVVGSATDPYQPVERERRLTRQVLQVLHDSQHPFCIVTKSSLVLRDRDLIVPMAEAGRAAVAVSLTSLDNGLKNQLEPRASGARERLRVIRELAAAGVPVTVLLSPLIPFINDHELEDMLGQAVMAGARQVSYSVLRLPHEVAPLWRAWLDEHYPERAEKVMSVVSQLHGGVLSRGAGQQRHRGRGPWAEVIAQRFDKASREAGIAQGEMPADLDCSGFQPLGACGQLGLWG